MRIRSIDLKTEIMGKAYYGCVRMPRTKVKRKKRKKEGKKRKDNYKRVY